MSQILLLKSETQLNQEWKFLISDSDTIRYLPTDESTKPVKICSSSIPDSRTFKFSPGLAELTSPLSRKTVTTFTITCPTTFIVKLMKALSKQTYKMSHLRFQSLLFKKWHENQYSLSRATSISPYWAWPSIGLLFAQFLTLSCPSPLYPYPWTCLSMASCTETSCRSTY